MFTDFAISCCHISFHFSYILALVYLKTSYVKSWGKSLITSQHERHILFQYFDDIPPFWLDKKCTIYCCRQRRQAFDCVSEFSQFCHEIGLKYIIPWIKTASHNTACNHSNISHSQYEKNWASSCERLRTLKQEGGFIHIVY